MSKAKLNPREKGMAKKSENEALAQQRQREEEERQEAHEWSKGAKDNSKQKEKEDKEAEKLRLKAEKAALEQADEAEAAKVARVGSGGGGGSAGKTKKQKDDANLLAAALSEIPKSKSEKEAEKKTKEAAEKRKLEEKKKADKEESQKKKEDELAKMKAKGIVVDASEELMIEVKKLNLAVGSDVAVGSDGQVIESMGASNIEDALNMSIFGGAAESASKEQQNLKTLYRAFCEREMPILKADLPGLRMTQYRQRVFDLWTKSPENPYYNKGRLPDKDWWKYEQEEDDDR